MLVKHGMRRSVAVRRIRKPSRNGRRSPVTVLITAETRPETITSTTFGWPSTVGGWTATCVGEHCSGVAVGQTPEQDVAVCEGVGVSDGAAVGLSVGVGEGVTVTHALVQSTIVTSASLAATVPLGAGCAFGLRNVAESKCSVPMPLRFGTK